MDFLEEPIVAYEVSYTRDGTDFPRLHEILDHAARYHLTLNTFYHPVYVAEWPTCEQAIAELGRYLAERQLVAAHLGNDALWRWWDARHRSTVHDVARAGDELRCDVLAPGTEGVIVKVPLQSADEQMVEVDGRPASWTLGQELGQPWAFVIVPAGDHRVAVRTSVR